MRFTVCESTSPPIKALLEQHFVLWYCHVDNSNEWYPYAAGLGSFTLPMITVISMNDSGNYLDRSTSVQYPNDFYARLKAHIGDVDHSVSITLSDVILSLQLLTSSQTQSLYKDGDINGDKQIGLPEVIYLLRELSL